MNKKEVLEKLNAEEKRLRKVLLDDAGDLKELQSDWQERDSPAERNLREVEWNQYTSLKDELVKIEEAKLRVENGTYGICEDCDEEISEKRLSVSPSAIRCIGCQQKHEKDAGTADRKISL